MGNHKSCRIKSRQVNKLDYRGELFIALHNDTDEYQEIENGERIAQIVITPFLPLVFKEVDELSDTKRGADGFGSTGEM